MLLFRAISHNHISNNVRSLWIWFATFLTNLYKDYPDNYPDYDHYHSTIIAGGAQNV